MRDDLPSGTVTFLFTDVEGSTRLLHDLGAEDYAAALAEHRRLIREACAAEGGVEVDTQGDAFFFAEAHERLEPVLLALRVDGLECAIDSSQAEGGDQGLRCGAPEHELGAAPAGLSRRALLRKVLRRRSSTRLPRDCEQ